MPSTQMCLVTEARRKTYCLLFFKEFDLVRLVPPVLSVLRTLCPLFPLAALLAQFLPGALEHLLARLALRVWTCFAHAAINNTLTTRLGMMTILLAFKALPPTNRALLPVNHATLSPAPGKSLGRGRLEGEHAVTCTPPTDSRHQCPHEGLPDPYTNPGTLSPWTATPWTQ